MDTASHPKTRRRPRPESHAEHSFTARVVALGGAVTLCAACVLCARWGFSEIILSEAITRQEALAERSMRTGEAALTREIREINEALVLAQRIDPGNPTTAESRGSLHLLNVRESDDGYATGGQQSIALEQFALALALRPGSPYTWANLARTKYNLGLVDAQFHLSMRNAILLGPWEPEVQFAVVDMGLALWDELPSDLRPKVLAMAQNGQRRYAKEIVAIAERRRRLSDICKFEKLALMPACKAESGKSLDSVISKD